MCTKYVRFRQGLNREVTEPYNLATKTSSNQFQLDFNSISATFTRVITVNSFNDMKNSVLVENINLTRPKIE